MKYKELIISRGGKEYGLAWEDIKKYLLTPHQWEMFENFMEGQTSSEISGIPIVYTGDYEKFIKGLPVINHDTTN